MNKECKIRYCKFCKKFFLNSCSCFENFNSVHRTLPSIISGVLTMIRNKLREPTQKFHPMFHSEKVQLSKYINLAKPDTVSISDYYVYMLTVNENQRKFSESKSPILSSSSAVSVNSKKSGSSSIFKFIGKTKTKKKKRVEGCYTNPFAEKEGDFSEDCQSDQTQHTVSDVIKEMPSKSKIPVLKRSVSRTTSYVSFKSDPKETASLVDLKNDPLWVHPSYTELGMPMNNLSTLEKHNFESDLREIDQIVFQVKESEIHIAHLISRHVQDSSFREELLQALRNHAKLQLEAERHTHTLTSEMWQHYNEIAKNREIQMLERLNSVTQQNRRLQRDMEMMVQKNEKLCVRLQQSPTCKGSTDVTSSMMEAMSSNNDKLRYNVSEMVCTIEKLECHLQKLQNRNKVLEEQLRDVISQVHNFKEIERRLEIDNKLEYEHLSQELQMNKALLKESAEAGNIVLEDLEGIKRQLQSTPCAINWTKFNSNNRSLPDLIFLCRSCINELSKELLVVQNNSVIKEKDIQCLREEIARNEEQLKQHKFEEDRLRNELKAISHTELELQSYKSKFTETERRFEEYKLKLEKDREGVDVEKNGLTATLESYVNLKKEVVERDEELLLLKEQAVEYKSENDALRMQLQGLKQVLSASGNGEVGKELAETQEKLATFQSQYYQILSEKNTLVDKLQSANTERLSLSQMQTSSSQFMQVQQRELDVIKNECKTLRQQLDLEHHQAITLRLERNKLREEKTILKQIYLQLKNEISRVQSLEGKVIGMNMEANRLAVIADYNKQLGEKLQCEVAERDVKITELETNMKELNNAQMEYAKDKVALCVELSEVCSLNEKLSNSLVSKHHKLDELHETKKQIETAASAQLRAAEHMQKVERTALMELLHDYKRVVAQRDSLAHAQSEYVKQLTELRANTLVLNKNIESANQNHLHNTKMVQNLENKLQSSTAEIRTLHAQIRNKDQECSQHKIVMEEMRKQGQALEASVPYLQNTIQHLHRDLDKSRESEMELQRALQNEIKKIETTEGILAQERRTLEDARSENERLREKCVLLTAQHEELLQKHRTLVDELATAEHEKGNCEMLEAELTGKNCQLVKLQEHFDKLSAQVSEMEDCMVDSEERSAVFVEMKTELSRLYSEHEQCAYVIEELRKAKRVLDQALQSEISKVESQNAYYQDYIEKLITKHKDIRDRMENDLLELSVQFDDMRSKYTKMRSEHEDLKKKQKYLAGELLTATQMVIDEKMHRLEAATEINQLAQENSRLTSEKVQTDILRESLENNVNDLYSKVNEQAKDKKKLQAIITHLKDVNSQLEVQLKTSKEEIKVAQSKLEHSENACKELENSLSDAQNCSYMSQEIMQAEKRVFNDSQKMNAELKIEIEKLKQNLTMLEFQRSEGTLRLHELKVALKTEENINAEMTKLNQEIVEELLKLDYGDLLPQVLERFIRPNNNYQNL